MKIAKILFTTLALVLVASVAFASEGGADPVMAAKAYATALGMAIAAGLCGIGQGMGVKSACEGIARNPRSRWPAVHHPDPRPGLHRVSGHLRPGRQPDPALRRLVSAD